MVDSATVQGASAPQDLPNESPDSYAEKNSAKKIVITIGSTKTKLETTDDVQEAVEAEGAQEQPKISKKPANKFPVERPRSDYPKTIKPIPPKPDYGPVEKMINSLQVQITEKTNLRTSLQDKVKSLSENLKGISPEGLDEDLKVRLKAVKQEIQALTKEKNEILDKLAPIKEQLRNATGNVKNKVSFASIERHIADLTDKVEHTSVRPEEEKQIRATIKKLSEQLKYQPQVRELEEQLDKVFERLTPIKAEKQELDQKAKEARQQNNSSDLSKSEIITMLKDLRSQLGTLNAELNELNKKKKEVTNKFNNEMRAFTSEERRFEAQTKHRAFLRKKWATFCNLINKAGASIVEDGVESGVFIVSSYPVTEIPETIARTDFSDRKGRAGYMKDRERGSREPAPLVSMKRSIEVAKRELAQWCEEALKLNTFGTTELVKVNGKNEVKLNSVVCGFLEILGLSRDAIADRDAVIKTLKICRNEPEELDEEAKAKAAEEALKCEQEAQMKAEEERARAAALEEEKQKRLAAHNEKIKSWLAEMINFKAVINYA